MRLFKSVWMSYNGIKALEAVKKEDNQVKLLEIAENALRGEVRLKAADKLSDRAIARIFRHMGINV